MPDKFGIPAIPPIAGNDRLYNVLVEQRAQLIRWINTLALRIAEAIAAGSGTVFLTDLEPIPGNRILGRESASPGPVGILEVGDGLWFTGLQMIGVANGGITNLKFRPAVGTSVVGRAGVGGGPVADIVANADGQFLQRAGGVLVWAAAPALSIPNDFITNAMLRDSAALSVIGRSASTPGDPADIVAAANQVLRESGGVLGFGLLGTANLAANAGITRGQLAIGSSLSVIGRSVNSPGAVADIIAANGSSAVLRENAGVIGWGQVVTAGLANLAVTDAKLRNSVGVSVIGRSANSVGAPADIVAAADGDFLQRVGGVLVFAALPPVVIPPGTITDAMLRNSAARSVIGRAANTPGAVADISATALSNHVLREDGFGAIGWGLIVGASMANGAVGDAQIRGAAALSLIGRSANTAGTVADIAAAAGSNAVMREFGSGLGWGLLSSVNLIPSAGITRGQLAVGQPCSVVGRSVNTVGALADIQATADGQILTRKAGVVAFTAPNQSYVIRQLAFDYPTLWGENAAGLPTLVLTNPTINNAGSSQNHFVGFLMGDTKVTWLRFGFMIPTDFAAGSTITPRITFLLNGAPAAGNVVELSIVSNWFQDNDSSGGGTGVFSTSTFTLTGYAAGDYVIADMAAIAVGFQPGFYYQGVIQRDARASNAVDTYADLIGIVAINFKGTRVVV